MPIYLYYCEDCLVDFEYIHGMNDPPLGQCSVCHKQSNIRKVTMPSMVINSTPRTLGGLADKRRSEMGESSYQEKYTQLRLNQRAKAAFQGALPNGAEPADRTYKDVRPFWRPDSSIPDTKLLNASPEALQKYVATGERPFGTT